MCSKLEAMFKRICVFCGSNTGARPAYAEAAEMLGKLLAARHISLVYGGGKVGLMGSWPMLSWLPEARSQASFPSRLCAKKSPTPG